MYICMFVYGFVHVTMPTRFRKGIGSPEAGDMGDCELPDIDAGY